MRRRLDAFCQTAAGILDQATICNDIKQVFRNSTHGKGLAVGADRVIVHIYGYDVAACNNVLNPITGQQKDAAVECIAEEDPCEALCNNAANPVVAQNRSRLLTGRTTAKIGASHQNVTRLDGRTKLRLEQLKSVLFHFLDGRDRAAFAGDDGIGIDVVSECPYLAAENFIHLFSPPYSVRV